jgi:surface protein
MRTNLDPMTGAVGFVADQYMQQVHLTPQTDTITRWSRSPYWMAMPSMSSSDEKFQGLFRVDSHGSNYVALTAQGAFTVNWGDGTVENFSSGATAAHNFAWSNANLTDSSGTLGYKQSLITVTPQAGQQITNFSLNVIHPSLNVGSNGLGALVGWLDLQCSFPNAAVGSSGAPSIVFNGVSVAVTCQWVERVKIFNLGNSGYLFVGFLNFGSLREIYASGLQGIKTLDTSFAAPSLEKAIISDLTNITNFTYTFGACYKLVEVSVTGMTKPWVGNTMFQYCYGLQTAPSIDLSLCTDATSMFASCTSLVSVPAYDLPNCTTVNSMFSGCLSLREVPLFTNTNKVTDWGSMFLSCANLSTVPAFDTSAATTFLNMFNGCSVLDRPPLLNSSNVTIFSGMFGSCTSLMRAPSMDTSKGQDFSAMFQNCYRLLKAPNYVLGQATTIASMFKGCYALESVPSYNTANVTSMSNLFYGCNALKSVPSFNTSNVTTMNSMFYGCYILATIPSFDTSKVTDFSYMFYSCYQITSIQPFNILAATKLDYMYARTNLPDINVDLTTNANCTAANMFNYCRLMRSAIISAAPKITSFSTVLAGCSALQTASLPALPVCTTLDNAFNGCGFLTAVSIGVCSALTNLSSMFTTCWSLKNIPLFDTSLVTNPAGMLSICAVDTVPAYNFNSATSLGLLSNEQTVASFLATNLGATISFSYNRLGATALATIFGNLKSNMSGKTITITGNPGVDAAVAKTGLTATAKSLTINMADTSSLAVGMLATNATVWAAVNMTADVTANTLTLTGHNIPNGTMVAFSSLGTVTGVTIWTIYYVVNATANTFQIALTPGGAAIDLTGTNGTMAVRWFSRIASITANTSITLDAPVPVSGSSQSISFRNLDTRLALLKGWAVTY